MEVKLNIESIIKDIRTKSHLEVSSIADPTARYRSEAGTEKIGEIKRDVASSVSSLVELCYRFIDTGGIDEVDNSITNAETVTIKLLPGFRRFDGKEKAIAQKIHEIIVDLSLQKFYVSVSQIDLSKAHTSLASAGIAELETMLRRKRPPKYIDR